MIRYDNISIEEARKLYEKAMRDAALSKYNFPSKPSSDGYYHIYVKDETKKSGRRAIKDKDLEKLKEKVYAAINIRFTFSECFVKWQDSKTEYIKDPEKLVSMQNTLARDKSEYKRFFEGSDFEKSYIDEITEDNIYSYTINILNKINFKYKTLNSYKSILLGVFKHAFMNGYVLFNPMERVDFARFKYMVEKSVPVSDRVHTDEEVEAMLSYARKYQSSHPSFIPAYALEMQILTGMRRGEIPPLTWDDVSDDRIYICKEQITLHNTPNHYEIVNHTKNYKDRFFPITKELNIFINKLKIINNKYYNSIFLFPRSTDPTKPIGNNAVYKFYYYKVCKDLGIKTCRDCIKGTHAFRRTGISNVVNKGYSFEIASALYGNSPNTAARNYYVGLNMEIALSALNGNQR